MQGVRYSPDLPSTVLHHGQHEALHQVLAVGHVEGRKGQREEVAVGNEQEALLVDEVLLGLGLGLGSG